MAGALQVVMGQANGWKRMQRMHTEVGQTVEKGRSNKGWRRARQLHMTGLTHPLQAKQSLLSLFMPDRMPCFIVQAQLETALLQRCKLTNAKPKWCFGIVSACDMTREIDLELLKAGAKLCEALQRQSADGLGQIPAQQY